MPHMYAIDEIFLSVQGEGPHAGEAMVFIRFYGCNLSCHWCDTPQVSYHEKTAEQIAREVQEVAGECRQVCFTGGEPFLQCDEKLVKLLKENGFSIDAETNGSIAIPCEILNEFRNVTVSPKTADPPAIIGKTLKIIYDGKSEIPDINAAPYCYFEEFYLQPLWQETEQQTVEFVRKNPNWKLSTQTHKFLGIK